MSDSSVQDMANTLAELVISAQDELGNDRFFMEVGQVLGASSQTLEEAFLTAIRTRMADTAARKFIEQKLKAHRASQASPEG